MTVARRVVVVGGGITGLAAAYRLARREPNGVAVEVTLLEADDRLGGKVRGTEVDGLRLEAGADSFVVRKPWAVDLCAELGLRDELVVPATRRAHVWTGGRLVPFPERASFGIPTTARGLLRWPGLPLPARVRALGDLFRPPRRGAGDEALGSLATRRLGRAAADLLVGPLLAGIHAGDPGALSVAATFPELASWEHRHGSLVRGARAACKRAATAPGAMFATVWGGLDRLVDALADGIGRDRIRTGTPVAGIRRDGGGFVVEAGHDLPADAVVLATPAFEAARLLRDVNAGAAGELDGIGYASTAVVLLVFGEETASALPDGTGFVVPAGERAITAATWVSRKWPQDGFGSRAVARCYVGRAGAEEALALSDEELVARVLSELEDVVGLGAPRASRVVRWSRSMPQYDVGHLERLARLERALQRSPGIVTAGAAYRGVGIADCVRQGEEAAASVLELVGARVAGEPPDRAAEWEAMTWTS